ncbi:MAG: hypothetical protein Q8L54_11540 [Devosia sp.]|nr:hypothetical protein [Devosia sp.]
MTKTTSPGNSKPGLLVETLLSSGFRHVGAWSAEGGRLVTLPGMPKDVGVYAFAVGGVVQYVGVATMGLAKRTYFYARPGVTQRTSLRINELLLDQTASGAVVDVYVATPENLAWRGLPVHGAAGLELGLIKAFNLPWNKRSVGP